MRTIHVHDQTRSVINSALFARDVTIDCSILKLAKPLACSIRQQLLSSLESFRTYVVQERLSSHVNQCLAHLPRTRASTFTLYRAAGYVKPAPGFAHVAHNTYVLNFARQPFHIHFVNNEVGLTFPPPSQLAASLPMNHRNMSERQQ